MEALRSSPFTAQIQAEMHAELDGMLDKAASNAAPIMERISMQQHGMSSEQDVRDLMTAAYAPFLADPTMSDEFKATAARVLEGVMPAILEDARRGGHLMVDHSAAATAPDPAAPSAAAVAPDGRDTIV